VEVFCKLTVLHLPGSLNKELIILQNTKILPGSLKMRKGVEIFLQNTSLFARKHKKGKRVKDFKKFCCRTHQYLPRGIKRGKESKIFKNFVVEHILGC